MYIIYHVYTCMYIPGILLWSFEGELCFLKHFWLQHSIVLNHGMGLQHVFIQINARKLNFNIIRIYKVYTMYILAHSIHMEYTWYRPCIIFIVVPYAYPGASACHLPVARKNHQWLPEMAGCQWTDFDQLVWMQQARSLLVWAWPNSAWKAARVKLAGADSDNANNMQNNVHDSMHAMHSCEK